MRQTLASIIPRLLESRFILGDSDMSVFAMSVAPQKRESKSNAEVSTIASWDQSGDSLFDILLSVLHGLLSSYKRSWLKPKSSSKLTIKSPRDFSAFDCEVLESLQTDLDRMELPATVRRRLQAAMPVLPQSLPLFLSCQPPTWSSAVLASLQHSIQTSESAPFPRLIPCPRPFTNSSSKRKALASLDSDIEVDPWTLLEGGTVSVSASYNNSNIGVVCGDHVNLKACRWLKDAMRVKRTDLTYVGALDDES